MARTINSADYFEIDSAVITGEPFTINVWFYAADTANQARLFSLVDKDTNNSYRATLGIFGNVAGDPVRFNGSATPQNFLAATTSGFSATTWHMATAVAVASNDHRVFLNGGSKGTDVANTVVLANLDRTSVGREGDSVPTAAGQNVRVAEISVWNVALTDAQIASLYFAGSAISALFVRPDNLIHYWRCLEQGATDNLQDIVGGQTLTQVSSPVVANGPAIVYPRPQQIILPPTVGGGGGTVLPLLNHYQAA